MLLRWSIGDIGESLGDVSETVAYLLVDSRERDNIGLDWIFRKDNSTSLNSHCNIGGPGASLPFLGETEALVTSIGL